MNIGILILNAGSSSLRFAVFDASKDSKSLDPMLRGQISGIGSGTSFSAIMRSQIRSDSANDSAGIENVDTHQKAIDFALTWLAEHAGDIKLIAAGHRVVHGGPDRRSPARVTPELLEELDAISRLAPHHQPHNLAAIRALACAKPKLPQVACFDTAFHATQSTIARSLALPNTLRAEGIIKYGFHGLSYEYITATVPAYNQGLMPEKLIVAHLGNGASLCAIEKGVSIACSMGFSTLDGLLMGTRCGTIDPGVLLYLMREHNMDETALSDLLYNQSGLLGVSGVSGDMQTLIDSQEAGAKEAVELFCYTLQKAIGSMAAALGGVDAIVFTGGIGENAAPIRKRVCESLNWLGLEFDDRANRGKEKQLSSRSSSVKVWVIPTNEELVIARHTIELM